MSVRLIMKDWPPESLYVERLCLRKTFQEFFTCEASLRHFGGDESAGVSLAGKDFLVQWQKDYGEEWQTLFRGRVSRVCYQTAVDHIHYEVEGRSHGWFTCEQEPVFRSYQHPDQTLSNILETIREEQDAFQFEVHPDPKILQLPHAVGMQLGETDFAYVRRLLSIYGIPILWDEESHFIIGCPGREEGRTILYRPQDDPYFSLGKRISRFQPRRAEAFPAPYGQVEWEQPISHDLLFSQYARERERRQGEADRARLEFQTIDRLFSPGDLIESAPSSMRRSKRASLWRIVAVEYRYVASGALFTHVTCVVSETGDYLPPFVPQPQEYNKLLGEVTRTQKDSQRLGRIQVRFSFPSEARRKVSAWLPVLTPYVGQGEGFCFLPEPGNKVMVDCLDPYQGIWAVTGVLRTREQPMKEDELGKVKVLQTSQGNRIVFRTSSPTQQSMKETLLIENGHNSMEWISKSEKAVWMFRQHGQEILQIVSKGKHTDIEIKAEGNIVFHAGGKIFLDAGKGIEVKANGNIKLKAKDDLILEGDEIHLN